MRGQGHKPENAGGDSPPAFSCVVLEELEKLVELDFMVVPEELSRAVVRDPVRIRIVDPEAIFLTGILGQSGRKLVAAGVEFYFTRTLAEKLITMGVAKEV